MTRTKLTKIAVAAASFIVPLSLSSVAVAGSSSGNITCGPRNVYTEGWAVSQQTHTTTFNSTYVYSGNQFRQKNWGTKPAGQFWQVSSPNSSSGQQAFCV